MTDRERQAAALLAKGVMTVAEVCDYLRIRKSLVYAMMADGRLPYTTIGGRRRRIPRAAVDRLLADGLRGLGA